MKSRTKSRFAARCSLLAVGASLFVIAGCRQDMHNQPKYRPLRASAFFEDTSSARPLVEGTIARGTLQTDTAFFTGKNGALLVNKLPFPVTQDVLDRGQQRSTFTARRATTRPAAATASSCHADFRGRRPITAIGCGTWKPATSSMS